MKLTTISSIFALIALVVTGAASADTRVANLTESRTANVRATLAGTATYTKAQSGYAWKNADKQVIESQNQQILQKWDDKSPTLAANGPLETVGGAVSNESGYIWGVRSTADQAGYIWGVRSTADQAGYIWGVRSAADQAGYIWGVRSAADQAGYIWGVR